MTRAQRILLVLNDDDTIKLIERNILSGGGYQTAVARSCAEAEKAVHTVRPDLMVLGDNLPDGDHLELAGNLLQSQPTLPIILFTSSDSKNLGREAVRLGLVDWISPPIGVDDFKAAVVRGLQRSDHWQSWLQQESTRYTGPLLQRVDELEALAEVGRTVTAQLDLDGVLTRVVDAAVELTSAEEGSILLIDENTGELYMRAARNFKDEFVHTFRMPVDETLPGEVIRTGEPLFFDQESQTKIDTGYLVHALIYVPLKMHGESVGVLGVDNRESGKPFTQRHVTLLSALADYASVAIENANLYADTDVERSKLENILTQVKDGVVVIDPQGRLVLVNNAARHACDLAENLDVIGKPFEEIFKNPNLLAAFKGDLEAYKVELKAADERTYNMQITEISGAGTVVTFHDISYLKELDRIRTDFVNAVSHDLRSPLTAILGYVELLDRVGEVNDRQRVFIDRVIASVQNITELITDLLHLGKLEIGMGDEIEDVQVAEIIQETLDVLASQAAKRKHSLNLDMPNRLSIVSANNVRMRQVMDNLIGNAIKYTPEGGKIQVQVQEVDDQIFIAVRDNGLGIPPDEQARIFDRFYRATNVPDSTQGTGLGLAITKQIVENHGGRIWVESSEKGTTFTVVVPVKKA